MYVYTLEFLLFLAFVGGSFLLLSPVSKRLDEAIAQVRDGLLTRMETKTGLQFSYSSLSPSILRSIKIRDLVIRDAGNGSVIASFSEVSVVYGFRQLITGDVAGAVRDIVIRDGAVTVDTAVNAGVIANLRDILKSGGSATLTKRDAALSPANGFRVHVDNVSMSVKNGGTNASFFVSRAHASVNGDGILFDLDGSVTLEHRGFSLSAMTNADISVNGSVDRSLDAGNVSLMLTSVESGNYSLSKLGLMVSFRNDVITCNSIGSLEPVDIRAEWNIAEKRLSASARCEGLLPLRWIRIRGNESSIAKKLENMSMTGSAFLTMENGKSPEYGIDMRANMPSALFGGGDARMRCAGDSSEIRFETLSYLGPSFDVSGHFTYDFASKMPEGYVSADKIALKNGSVLSTEMYVQPEGSRFICLFPEIDIGDSVFSSVECAIEPGAEAIGFSVSAYDESGRIGMEGTFSTGAQRFLELYSSFDSISVANAARAYSAIATSGADISDVVKRLEPFALTTEAYLSTDFTEFSFNCTRLVLASEEANGLYFLLSAKGNASGIDFTDIRFSANGYDFAGNVYAVLEENGSVAFNADATVNTIPYALSGSWGDGNLVVSGDYGLSASAFFGSEGLVSGYASSSGIPIPAGKNLLSVSFDASFRFASISDWNIVWNTARVEDAGNALPLSTVVSFTGTTDPTGMVLDTIAVYDRVSSLGGSASMVLREEGLFDAAVSLSDANAAETLSAKGTIALSGGLSCAGTVQATQIPLMRFFRGQLPTSRLTATISGAYGPAGGNATAIVNDMVWRFGDFDMNGKGKFEVSGGTVRATDVNATWNGHAVSALDATVMLDTYDATLSTDYSLILGKSPITAKLDAVFKPQARASGNAGETAAGIETGALDNYTVSLKVSDAKWKTYALDEPFAMTLDHTPGVTAMVAGKNDALSGYILDDGSFSLQSGTSIPLSFNADGKISGSTLSIGVKDLVADLPVLWPALGIAQIEFLSGLIRGDFSIDGSLNDPDFHGVLNASNIVVTAPGLFGEPFGPTTFDLIADGKSIVIPETTLKGKDGAIRLAMNIGFDQWIPATFDIHGETPPGDRVRVLLENQFVKAEGYSSFAIDLGMDSSFYELGGSVEFERGAFVIQFSGFDPSARTIAGDLHDWKINLALNVGEKVEFRWPNYEFPVLRGLVQAEKPIDLNLDTSLGSFSVKGDVNLKGGQFFYIKRNFYLRKGMIVFNENQDFFDPMLTLHAEIRENDENGKPVRIVLSVDNKPLSSFTPILSADPPKSDIELMVLLGQATSADVTKETFIKDAVITTSDILTQMSLFRSAENSVRDLLNLDIFSIRTLIIQNAILGPGERASSGTDATMTIGNYFDNTTVYLGKYLGSAIYADALMHFSYYNPLLADTTGNSQIVYQNLLIQPEFGFEVTTPLFLVRFSVTPISPDTLFIADTSITLSRKFSY